jgi:hypothetical protein
MCAKSHHEKCPPDVRTSNPAEEIPIDAGEETPDARYLEAAGPSQAGRTRHLDPGRATPGPGTGPDRRPCCARAFPAGSRRRPGPCAGGGSATAIGGKEETNDGGGRIQWIRGGNARGAVGVGVGVGVGDGDSRREGGAGTTCSFSLRGSPLAPPIVCWCAARGRVRAQRRKAQRHNGNNDAGSQVPNCRRPQKRARSRDFRVFQLSKCRHATILRGAGRRHVENRGASVEEGCKVRFWAELNFQSPTSN